ncbi:hypothetical protein BANRA_05292 [Klebsiella quasipneumoniae]|nr:hypothetical protein BANRA_05292 [Klebsiella quasipneumoniae]
MAAFLASRPQTYDAYSGVRCHPVSHTCTLRQGPAPGYFPYNTIPSILIPLRNGFVE